MSVEVTSEPAMWKTTRSLLAIALLVVVGHCRVIDDGVVENPNLQQVGVAVAPPRPTPDLHMFDNPRKKKKVLASLPAVTASEEAFVFSGVLKANAIGLHGTEGCPPGYRPVCAGRKQTKYWPPVTFKNDCELHMFNERNWDADLKIMFEDECENWPDRDFTSWTEAVAF